MNIFTALSPRADSQLREPNLSAILAYFLNPAQDHGFGSVFLNEFLELVGIPKEMRNQFAFAKTDISTEKRHKGPQGEVALDIIIELVNSKDDSSHLIVVENKIRPGAANLTQLKRYYNVVAKNYEEPENQITMVFLTPKLNSKNLDDEYKNLELPLVSKNKKDDNKTWLYWTGAKSIQTIIRDNLLKKEANGEISPINEYAKHTLKAFVMHLETLSPEKQKERVASSDSIKIMKIDVNGMPYTIEQHANTAIKVYDHKGEEEENTKKILRKIIKQHCLDVKPENSNNKKKNTRQLGAHVIAALEEKNIQIRQLIQNLPAV